MTQESLRWLQENTLIGFTEKRGNAWHHREGVSNTYRWAIPVEDVRDKLFAWQAQERPLYVGSPGSPEFQLVEGRKAIVRSDTEAVLGIFKDGYRMHQYDEWLLKNVATLLDDGLAIGSAVLLKGGAQAYVQVEAPENIQTAGGEIRPFLSAWTSFDGSLATGYGRGHTRIVCDNTGAAARTEAQANGSLFRVKHTVNSLARISDAREALGIVFEETEALVAEIDRLVATEISDKQFLSVLDIVVPTLDKLGNRIEGRSLALATSKRDAVQRMYTRDQRVQPWSGTAYGVLQAFTTYQQHEAIVRGVQRVERNFSNLITGQTAQVESEVLAAIAAVS